MKLHQVVLIALFCICIHSLFLQKHNQIPECFWKQLSDINSTPQFTYTVTKTWTNQEKTQIEEETTNVKDFINVDGWKPYNPKKPFLFFTKIGKFGLKAFKTLTPIKQVQNGADAPEFELNDDSLHSSFGNPSTASIYQVPQGKNLVLLRFQVKSQGQLQLGRESILLDIVNQQQILKWMNEYENRYNFLQIYTKITALDVARALNISPDTNENSFFQSLALAQTTPINQPQPIIVSGFIERLPSGQKFLAGYINKGQQNIIQIKDLLPQEQRSECPKIDE